MKILVPVDFHKTSFVAYVYANQLAEKLGASITLMHVVNGTFNTDEALVYTPIQTMEEAAMKRLKYFAKSYPEEEGFTLKTIDTSFEVRFGIPGFSVANYADDQKYDLIVMGTKDKHSLISRWLGSVSAIAIRQAQCPVLLIHENARFNDIEKIAFAFDAKSDIEDAIETFKKINTTLRAKVDFVHVNTKADDALNHQKDEILEELFEETLPNFSFEIKVLEHGDLQTKLKDYCLYEKIDMLAMMHRKEGLFTNLFRTNQSVRMAQDFHLPVLVFQEQ